MFPGLYLQPDKFWADDLPALLATVQRGLNTPDHAKFKASLV
jgi:hypothetical protein